ncbi:hypothetical protein POM88_035358 [Heracleum sosnowskyi]|uniref:Uncharacterized protein n=1 Tax=Heracleum sosnowskyi TaxID=360622 RepID=A0AAD8HMA3_9APIA|nr:hypothetical protein POM88_035358 [Heracleum sosnowskyi]
MLFEGLPPAREEIPGAEEDPQNTLEKFSTDAQMAPDALVGQSEPSSSEAAVGPPSKAPAAVRNVKYVAPHLRSQGINDSNDHPQVRRRVRDLQAALKFAEEHGFDLVTLHPGFVLGPLLKPDLNVTSEGMLNFIKKGQEILPGGIYRFVAVRDVVCEIYKWTSMRSTSKAADCAKKKSTLDKFEVSQEDSYDVRLCCFI